MIDRRVQDYYSTHVRQEWRRLVRDSYNQLEYLTSLRFIEKYFPARGHALDAGGGPGRYTLELARRGYQVTLLDMTPANLTFARRQLRRAGLSNMVPQWIEGTLSDLSRFPDETFDAVACLGGPLSHILDAEERAQAVHELVRVARPGAPVIVAVMSRLGMLALELDFQHEIKLPHFTMIRDTGDYDGSSGFTACHFFLPEELRAAFEHERVEVLEMAGLEGLGSNHYRKVNRLAKDSAAWGIWLDTHFRTCTHPAVVGMSDHMLLVARKLSSV